MISPEQPACAALISYMHGDDDLLYRLRMMWEWKDEELQRLVETTMRCLEEIESDETVHRSVTEAISEYHALLD